MGQNPQSCNPELAIVTYCLSTDLQDYEITGMKREICNLIISEVSKCLKLRIYLFSLLYKVSNFKTNKFSPEYT